MFQYQVDSLRGTINKILKRPRPPEIVRIKMAHADYLGVRHWFAKPINEVRAESGIVTGGVPYGAVVCVYVIDLFNALKDAQGIDVKEIQRTTTVVAPGNPVGEQETQQPNHGEVDSPSEGAAGPGPDEPGSAADA